MLMPLFVKRASVKFLMITEPRLLWVTTQVRALRKLE